MLFVIHIISYYDTKNTKFPSLHTTFFANNTKDTLEQVKGEDRPLNRQGYRVPNIRAMDEYNLTQREKRVIMDEVRGKTGNARALRPPVEAAKVDHRKTNPKSSYLELLRCGGKMKSNGEASRYATRLDHFGFEKRPKLLMVYV